MLPLATWLQYVVLPHLPIPAKTVRFLTLHWFERGVKEAIHIKLKKHL